MTRKLFPHIVCWALFILYEVSVAKYMGDHSSLAEFGCFYALNITLFYFNADVILRRLSARRSFGGYVAAGLLMLPELAIYSYVAVVLHNAFGGPANAGIFTHIATVTFISALWRGIYFAALSVAYFALSKAIRAIRETSQARIGELDARNRSERLEKDLAVLQNAYLRAQINPHFLFNTLNFLYNQAEEGHPDTADNIASLSEIMQYSLTSPGEDGKVPLCRETEQIKRYISLNLSRFGHTLFLEEKITVDETAADARIPPLVLLTFVENVFKHGDMTDAGMPALVEISYAKGRLTFHSRNKKKGPHPGNRKHVGLKNAFMRLYAAYPREHVRLTTKDGPAVYEMTLNLSL